MTDRRTDGWKRLQYPHHLKNKQKKKQQKNKKKNKKKKNLIKSVTDGRTHGRTGERTTQKQDVPPSSKLIINKLECDVRGTPPQTPNALC